MEFKFSPEEDAFRQELRDFIARELPPTWEGVGRYPEEEDWELTRAIRRKLAAKGWLTMHWPKEYGGQDGSPIRGAIYSEELAYFRAPGRDIFGVRMLAPTLMHFGNEEQKARFLPPIAKADVQWCQGFSEPGAGSDLASLSTRAVKAGDDYVVNGAKIWTSLGHKADWMMLLARTNQEAEKHRGISFLLLDMKTPGVQVRRINDMSGASDFNEVTFDNVRVPVANRLGEEDRGWYVAVKLLEFERSAIELSAATRRLLDDLHEYASEVQSNGRPLIELPWVRQALAERYAEVEVARLMAYNVAFIQGQGLSLNREASISKLFGSETFKRTTNTAQEILGLYGTLSRGEKWAALRGRSPEIWEFTFSHTIAAGTSEIQRNIIAMRGLGLPRG